MLFDLKGKRRRFIQVTYVILAILFGVGLVGFGVGSDATGGLFDALTGKGGGGGSQSQQELVDRYQKQVKANPRNERAWLQLARAEYAVATSGDNYDQRTGQFKQGAVGPLQRAARAWERYLKRDPRRPDPNVAGLIARVYQVLLSRDLNTESVALARNAARAQGIFANARPSANSFFELAMYRYLAGDIAAGDQAASTAISRTPKDQRNVIRPQLKEQGSLAIAQFAVLSYALGDGKQGDRAAEEAVSRAAKSQSKSLRSRIAKAKRQIEAQGKQGQGGGQAPGTQPFQNPFQR